MKNSTVLHIPHSSTFIPERFAGTFIRGKLAHEIDVMTDWFCDELFECGRDSVIFPVSRLVSDVERFADDEQVRTPPKLRSQTGEIEHGFRCN